MVMKGTALVADCDQSLSNPFHVPTVLLSWDQTLERPGPVSRPSIGATKLSGVTSRESNNNAQWRT